MARPKITNVWATQVADGVCRRSASRVVIEATELPAYRVSATPAGEVRVCLPGCELAMAPAEIRVNDGLITTATVAAGPSSPSVTLGLEHAPSWVASEAPGIPARLVIDMDRSAIRTAFEGKVIVVDPGHGGADAGARGPVNLVEKKVVLEIARCLSSRLALAGASVVMTRSSDEALPRPRRFLQAKEVGADAFVSIHAFSSADRAASGARTLYAPVASGAGRESERLARHVQASLVQKLPVRDRGVAKCAGRLPCDFFVPCVFVEVAAITNWVEEGWLRSATFKERAADAVVIGLKRYFVERVESSPTPAPGRTQAGRAPVKVDAIPVRTHLVREREDITELARRYTRGIARPGDLIAVAESVVAIAQGRALLPESVRPGALARLLSRLPGKDGSLATPPAMQLAIDEAGATRVLLGTVAAGLGRIAGRRGDFFRVAGRSLAQIDDIAGTMPPYDKHVVLGPIVPGDVARAIKAATGVDAVVADVNDMGCVDILGSTLPSSTEWVSRALRDNPFGNDDQQTPVVVLKPHRF